MQIILDKNTATERTFEIDSFEERIIDNRLSGSKQFESSSTFPTIDVGDKTFTTIEIIKRVNGADVDVPIYGTYNVITSIQTSTFDGSDYLLFMNISFGYQQ